MPIRNEDKGYQPYFNPLHLVLILLWLESQLNEKLLQLLVAVVDAKLLEAEIIDAVSVDFSLQTFAANKFAQLRTTSPVDGENFKTIDVQQPDHCFPERILQKCVGAQIKNPLWAVVRPFGEEVTSFFSCKMYISTLKTNPITNLSSFFPLDSKWLHQSCKKSFYTNKLGSAGRNHPSFLTLLTRDSLILLTNQLKVRP